MYKVCHFYHSAEIEMKFCAPWLRTKLSLLPTLSNYHPTSCFYDSNLCQIPHKGEIIQDHSTMHVKDVLISWIVTPPHSQAHQYGKSQGFLFIKSQCYSRGHTSCIFFIQLFIDRRLNGCLVLTIGRNITMSTNVHVPQTHNDLISFAYTSSSRMLDHWYFNVCYAFPPTICENSHFSNLQQHLLLSSVKAALPVTEKWYIVAVLVCISMITSDVQLLLYFF